MSIGDRARVPVGLLIGDWLGYSETFIYDQVLHQRRTRLFVCGRRELPGAQQRFPYPDVCTLPWMSRKAFLWLRHAPAFREYLANAGTKLIHAHFGTNGAHALDLADALEVPLAVTFHGHDVGGLSSENRLELRYVYYRFAKNRLFNRSGALICASSDLATRLLALGAPSKKIVVHRLGIDLERFPLVERPPVAPSILMVGRLVEKKGMEFGLRAFAAVHAQHPDIRLRIVGDGPLRSSLASLASELGVAKYVHFTGALAPAQVVEEMRRAHVMLTPSVVAKSGDIESGVIVIKEAAATGIPTIGTLHGGIPEIIDDEQTGYLVPERDVGALTERLRHLVENQGLIQTLGRAARTKMEREYDTRIQNERLEEILLGLL